ncbi:hypothetical protein vnz_23370 [Streptomyces venezuelae]|nr:hypothetical protein vnz_23370 [Streptomyces venezuelae]
MTHRGRPRVHLLTGGPAWEERRPAAPPTPRKKLPKKQRSALKQLDASLLGLKVALRHRQLGLARQLRSAAWDQVDLLPAHLTYEQRRELFQAKLAIHALARHVDGQRRA